MKLISLVLLLTTLSVNAFSIPKDMRALENSVDPFFKNKTLTEVEDNFTSDFDFSGIVSLSNCSGSLIKFKGDTNIDKPALIMTNGHCMGVGSAWVAGSRMPAMGEVILNHPKSRQIGLFSKNPRPVGNVNTTRIVYGTMTDTDVAIYELNKTYRDIASRYGIDPLVLSDRRPVEDTQIEILSGYWKRAYACTIDAFIYKMQEGAWIWNDSIRYSQPGCKTIGGTSGSPIIDAVTREVVGINNTGNEDGELCTVMNPCEIDEQGQKVAKKGESYGQETYLIYTCLDSNFNIDLNAKGCLLPKKR